MQPLLMVLAAAFLAPAEELARRRLPTPSCRRGEEQASVRARDDIGDRGDEHQAQWTNYKQHHKPV
jgi:hypothetical protein